MNDFIYTLAFIRKNDEILMINRQKNPWQGMWNGVGGKRKNNESPLDCIIREIEEETGIRVTKKLVIFKGICTWNDEFKSASSGLYMFLVQLPKEYTYETPRITPEGILDWKKIDWISDTSNLGVAYNIPYFMKHILVDQRIIHYDCTFKGNNLINVKETDFVWNG
jgi:8-oxo-dGTP diphosphatase